MWSQSIAVLDPYKVTLEAIQRKEGAGSNEPSISEIAVGYVGPIDVGSE